MCELRINPARDQKYNVYCNVDDIRKKPASENTTRRRIQNSKTGTIYLRQTPRFERSPTLAQFQLACRISFEARTQLQVSLLGTSVSIHE